MAREIRSPGEPGASRAATRNRLGPNGVEAVVSHVQQILDAGSTYRSYPALGRDHGTSRKSIEGILKRSGLNVPYGQLREEQQNVLTELFPHTPEVAWFLGMVFGNSGRVETNPPAITFTNANAAKLEAFRQSGEHILGRPGLTDTRRDNDENFTTSSVSFNSTKHVAALGDFHKPEKPHTVRERHDWVRFEPFLSHFVSGVFDSGGFLKWQGTKRQIDFYTSIPDVAEFYKDLLVRMGITRARILPGRTPDAEVLGVRIGTLEDIKTFADKVSSVDGQTQEQLDALKTAEKRRGVVKNPESIAEIVDELRRVSAIVGHFPTSDDIQTLRDSEEPTFSVWTLRRFLGDMENGKTSFSAARVRGTHLLSLEGAELEQEIALLQEQKFGNEIPIYP